MRKNLTNKNSRGFTLLEVVVYLGFLASIATVCATLAFRVLAFSATAKAQIRLEQELEFVRHKLAWHIGQADDFDMSTDGQRLMLNTDTTKLQVKFNPDENMLQMSDNAETFSNLLPGRFEVLNANEPIFSSADGKLIRVHFLVSEGRYKQTLNWVIPASFIAVHELQNQH